MDFVQLDARGRPVVDCCWVCADKAGRLRPDMAAKGMEGVTILLARFRGGASCLEDPTFKDEMTFALNKPDEETFMPGSEVFNMTAYGIRVTQPYALFTESEYAGLLEAVPSAIKMKPTTVPFQGPGLTGNFYTLDMQGLPVDVQNSCKKMEVFYCSQTQHNESFLNHLTQLHQAQGERVFQYIAQSAMANRPEKARPTAKPMTLAEAQSKHQQAEANAAAAPAAAAQSQDDEPGEASPAKAVRTKAFGIVAPSLAKAAAKQASRKGGRGKAVSTGVTSEDPITPTRPAAAADKDGADDVASESTVAKSKLESQLARLDSDMRLVAEKHLQNHSNGSVKSLESLVPLKYLLEASKPLSIALTSVRTSSLIQASVGLCRTV